MWDHLPLIVIEVVMIFGGALAFGWWQLRDLKRERERRERREALEHPGTGEAGTAGDTGNAPRRPRPTPRSDADAP